MPDRELTPLEIRRNRERLRYVRPWMRHRDLTQRYIAEKLGVSEPSVSKWLNGTQTISIQQFFHIAELLKARPEDILGGGPGAPNRGGRYRKLAELADAMTDEGLDDLLKAAERMLRGSERRTGSEDS